MLSKNGVRLIIVLLSLVGGCDSDNGVGLHGNEPPSLSFASDYVAVVRDSVVTLAVDVNDPEGDRISVVWHVTGGSLNPSDQGGTVMRWMTPDTVGVELAGAIDLGLLKGNIGNQNYEIPADIDLDAFASVVIWCEPFRVPFNAASLTVP